MENNFDIEKYRVEQPMDYIKAMKLIMSCSNKNDVFKAIYQITRLHIPNMLFKYYSLTEDERLNELKLETLLNEKIYMSDVKSLNDPFDNKAFFYRSKELIKYKELSAYNGKIFDDLSSFSRVASFTGNGVNCMPMWAHYSNNHKGFCVSYDMKNPNNSQLSGCIFPIQYSDQRIDITSLMEQQVKMILCEKEKQMNVGKKEILIDDLTLVFIISFLGNIKHDTWSYEKEYRCTAGANAKEMPFFKAVPKEIYIGKDCSPIHIKKLVDMAYSLNIPIFQMSFDEYDINYNLIPKKIG